MRGLKTHTLKVWPKYFIELMYDIKKFEIRENDRDYKIGDHLILHEFDPDTKQFTGRALMRSVNHIHPGGSMGIPDNLVVMSLAMV
jgi:hypothetical protein